MFLKERIKGVKRTKKNEKLKRNQLLKMAKKRAKNREWIQKENNWEPTAIQSGRGMNDYRWQRRKQKE